MIRPDAELDSFLAEDAPFGDLTTDALGIGAQAGRVTFTARYACVVCCVEEAERMFARAGCAVRRRAASGAAVDAGTLLLEAHGTVSVLHHVWRAAQVMVEHASGIATATRAIATAARTVAPDIAVECTRKHLPGGRGLASRAVRAGGGTMHRLGLSESVLIFAEHAAFLGGLDAVAGRIPELRRRLPGHKIAVEVKTIADALRMAEAGADVIQLDKLSPADVRAVVEAVGGRSPAPAVVAAGGVNAGNAAAYAATGCQALATSAPYWAKPMDVAVMMEPV